MKRTKRLASVGIVAAGALLLASCGGDADPTNDATTPGGTTGGASEEWDFDVEAGLSTDPVTLSIWLQDQVEDDPFTNPVAQKITEATGVTLEVQHPISGDTDALSLILQGGDFPDMVHAKGDLSKWIEAEAVIPLDDYFESPLGENLKAFYGENITRLKLSNDDPTIYHVGTGGVSEVAIDPEGAVRIQMQVLKEAGYPEIKTLDELGQVIADYKAAHPTTADGQSTIGLTMMTTDWRWLITLGNPSGYVAGYHDDGQWIVDRDTGEAVYKFRRDEVKDWFKWLTEMNDQGLLDPESFTQTEDQYFAKIAAGRVIALPGAPDWLYTAPNAELAANNPWAQYAPTVATAAEGIHLPHTMDFGYTGTQGIAITSTSDHKERAFKFLDWFATEEAQILVNWGVEGLNYEINEDGFRVATDREAAATNPNYGLDTGIGAYIHPFPRAGNAALDSNGQNIDRNALPEDRRAGYTDVVKEVLDAYDAETWNDIFPDPSEIEPSKHGRIWEMNPPESVNEVLNQVDNQMPQKLREIIEGGADNFEANWANLQTFLDGQGLDPAQETMTALVKDRLELWGTN